MGLAVEQRNRIGSHPDTAAVCPICRAEPGVFCPGGLSHGARHDASQTDPDAVLRLLDADLAKGVRVAARWLRRAARDAAGVDPCDPPEVLGKPWVQEWERDGTTEDGPEDSMSPTGNVSQFGTDPNPEGDGYWEEPVIQNATPAVATYAVAVQPAVGVALAGVLDALAEGHDAGGYVLYGWEQAVVAVRVMLTLASREPSTAVGQ